MNRPKHARCDYCGRNTHKIAVRYARHFQPERYPGASGLSAARMVDEVVRGYCPTCWEGRKTANPDYALKNRVANDPNASVIYDARKKKVTG